MIFSRKRINPVEIINKESYIREIPDVPKIERMKLNEGVDEKIKRPPLGLVPKFIIDEKRLNEIKKAIDRYMDENYKIPLKWIEEYNELCDRIKK